ncbi:MAG: serine protease, partial [Lachnospiraceae bacterium]|nr:serine protease [Lachnospiraceae bacterium]
MKNNKQDKETELEFSFVQEKVKSKTRRRVRKILIGTGCTLVFAVIFGFVARLVFVKSEGLVNTILGITPAPTEQVKREEVKLPTGAGAPVSPTPTVTGKDEITPTPADTPTPTPTEELTPSPTEEPTPSPTPATGDGTGEDGQDGTGTGDDEGETLTYKDMMGQMAQVVADVSKSLLTVTARTTEVNWLDESIVKEEKFSGVVMGDNGVELLLLANLDKVVNADEISVLLSSNLSVEAMLYNSDSEFNLAVLSIPLEDIPEYARNETDPIEFGSSVAIAAGTPVIALGSPNGHNGSVGYGFVTTIGDTSYVTDGRVDLFYTDMTKVEGSDGIIVNLDGQLVGLISNGMESGFNIDSSMAIGISSVERLILRLLNGVDRPYIGIMAEDIPSEDLKRLDLANGIYVSNVIDGSPAQKAGIKKGDVITDLLIGGMDEPSVIRSVSGYMAAIAPL